MIYVFFLNFFFKFPFILSMPLFIFIFVLGLGGYTLFLSSLSAALLLHNPATSMHDAFGCFCAELKGFVCTGMLVNSEAFDFHVVEHSNQSRANKTFLT